jgi:hypothetical protein
MIHLHRLIESRPMLERIPDQSLIGTVQAGGGEHQRACRDTHGRWAMLYLPMSQTLRVNCAALTGATFRDWWFNPRTGAAAPTG